MFRHRKLHLQWSYLLALGSLINFMTVAEAFHSMSTYVPLWAQIQTCSVWLSLFQFFTVEKQVHLDWFTVDLRFRCLKHSMLIQCEYSIVLRHKYIEFRGKPLEQWSSLDAKVILSAYKVNRQIQMIISSAIVSYRLQISQSQFRTFLLWYSITG